MNSTDNSEMQKALFVWRAVDKGWTVKKRGNTYVFTKPHENKKQIYTDTYLREFVVNCMNSAKTL